MYGMTLGFLYKKWCPNFPKQSSRALSVQFSPHRSWRSLKTSPSALMSSKAVNGSLEQQSLAASDFRSDTVTTPTQRMLESMLTSTHGDAVFNEDQTTTTFEAHVAELLGKEKGLFVPSGTAGNQIALRVHLTQPPHSVLCDHLAHVAIYEAGGMAILSQALLQPVIPSNGIYLTAEDVKRAAILGEDIHVAPTRVISLENTQGGTIMPLEEVRKISAFARANNIKMHLDGARLWNACAAGAGSFKEFAEEFDSVSVCFSKGLGAPVGSVLVGNAAFIGKANWIRKAIGGGMRQTGVLTNAAWVALEEVYPKLTETHIIAKDLESHFARLGLKTSLPVQTNMVFIDLKAAGLQNSWLVEEGTKRGIRFGYDGRVVIHHQICPEAVEALKQTVEAVVLKAKSGAPEYASSDANKATGYGTMQK